MRGSWRRRTVDGPGIPPLSRSEGRSSPDLRSLSPPGAKLVRSSATPTVDHGLRSEPLGGSPRLVAVERSVPGYPSRRCRREDGRRRRPPAGPALKASGGSDARRARHRARPSSRLAGVEGDDTRRLHAMALLLPAGKTVERNQRHTTDAFISTRGVQKLRPVAGLWVRPVGAGPVTCHHEEAAAEPAARAPPAP